MNERSEPGTDRVTVSMPRGYKAQLEQAVAAGAAASVSALVTSAVEEHLARRRTDEWIRSRRGGRPIDPDALAWARRALGVDADLDEGAAPAQESA